MPSYRHALLAPLSLLLLLSFGAAAYAAESVAPDSGAARSQEALPAAPSTSAAPGNTEPAAKESTADSEQDTPAAETDRLFSRDYHLCMDAAAGTTLSMQDCINAETERLDKRITEQRERLMPQLSEERAKALAESLLAWESLRKNGSTAMYDPDGGTLATIIASLWYLEQTARTSRWLDSLLESSAP